MFEIRELITYAHTVRRKFAEKMATLPWDEVSENREASYYSMKNILVHIIDGEYWWVHTHILGKQGYTRKKGDDYTSMEMVFSFMTEAEQQTDGYLRGVDEKELRRPIAVTMGANTFQLSIEECLMQTFTEQLYHLGEIIALMWQKEVEPPRMQWFANNPRAAATTTAAASTAASAE